MTGEDHSQDTNRRIDERLPVMWHGRIVTEDDTVHTCEICDISTAGTLINCQATLDPGQDVILQIDGLGEFAGSIRWASSPQLGLVLMAGPDLALKRFAESSPDRPIEPEDRTGKSSD